MGHDNADQTPADTNELVGNPQNDDQEDNRIFNSAVAYMFLAPFADRPLYENTWEAAAADLALCPDIIDFYGIKITDPRSVMPLVNSDTVRSEHHPGVGDCIRASLRHPNIALNGAIAKGGRFLFSGVFIKDDRLALIPANLGHDDDCECWKVEAYVANVYGLSRTNRTPYGKHVTYSILTNPLKGETGIVWL